MQITDLDKSLIDQAKFWYSSLVEFVFKHTSIQLIILGWVLTQGDKISAPYLASGVIICYSILVFFLYNRIFKKSHAVYSRLDNLDCASDLEIWTFKIENRFWIGMWGVHVMLSILSVLLLLDWGFSVCTKS